MYPESYDVLNANGLNEKRRLAGLWYENTVQRYREELKHLKSIINPTKRDKWHIAFLEGFFKKLNKG